MAAVNGTAALHIALLVAGVKPGDEVLVSALTLLLQRMRFATRVLGPFLSMRNLPTGRWIPKK